MNYLKSHKLSQSESYTMIFKILQSSRKMRFWLDIQWNSTAQQYLRCQFQDILLFLLLIRFKNRLRTEMCDRRKITKKSEISQKV